MKTILIFTLALVSSALAAPTNGKLRPDFLRLLIFASDDSDDLQMDERKKMLNCDCSVFTGWRKIFAHNSRWDHFLVRIFLFLENISGSVSSPTPRTL